MTATKEELRECSKKLDDTLRKSKLNNGQQIVILEALKLDLLFNSGIVKIDGYVGYKKTKKK